MLWQDYVLELYRPRLCSSEGKKAEWVTIGVFDLPFEAVSKGPQPPDCACCQKTLKQLHTYTYLRLGGNGDINNIID